MDFKYLEVSHQRIDVQGVEVHVHTSSVPPSAQENLDRFANAVVIGFGPVFMGLTAAEAIELGDALIRAAHHYRSHAIAHFDEPEACTVEATA